jgi:hypothetical protein
MEAFQILSTGGVKFNKVKYKKDVNLFTVCVASLAMVDPGLELI